MEGLKLETRNSERTRRGATLVEVLVALVILVVGIWAALQIFSPGLVLRKDAGARQVAIRFAQGQRARLGQLPIALVARNRATGVVDSSVSSSSKLWDYDYLYQARTILGEKIQASPYVFVRLGPVDRATQLAYFPEPYDPLPDPDPTSIDLLPPRYYPDPLLPGPQTPGSDSWQYTRRYTPAATYLAFDDYAANVDGDTDGMGNPINEPRWLLLNYSYLDAGGQVQDVVGNLYSLPPTEYDLGTGLEVPATYTLTLPVNVIPGSETVFRVVGTSLYPPIPTTVPYRYAALPYQDDDPATPADETTPEGSGIFAFKFRAQGQGPGQVALPLPGETLLANYDFAGHAERLDFGSSVSPSYQNVSLPDILWEDHLVPAPPAPPEIHLHYKPPAGDSALTGACPSYLMAVVKESPAAFDVTLAPGPPPVVASQSGRLFPDSTPGVQDRVGPDALATDIDVVDARNGILRFAPEIAGKWVRVYYRLARSWLVHVAKSAAEYAVYVPDSDPSTPLLEPSIGLPAIWDDSDPANRRWRALFDDPSVATTMSTPKQFWLIPSIDGASGKTILSVPASRESCQGAEVAVDYVYQDGKRANGEEHRIDKLPSGYGFTLNHASVNEISSIRGASARVRVAWRGHLNFYKLSTQEIRADAVWRGSESD